MATPWTDEEEAILQEHYPTGGPGAVMAAMDTAGLPGRTRGALIVRAQALGLEAAARTSRPHPHSTKIEDQDAETLRAALHGLDVAIEQTLADLSEYMQRHARIRAALAEKLE